jgi:hypothetical protein
VATIPWYLSKLRDSTNVSSPVVMCLHLVAIPSQRQRAGHECADSAGILHAVSTAAALNWNPYDIRGDEGRLEGLAKRLDAVADCERSPKKVKKAKDGNGA